MRLRWQRYTNSRPVSTPAAYGCRPGFAIQRRGARPCAPTPYVSQRRMKPPNPITAQAPQSPPFAKGGLEGLPLYLYLHLHPTNRRQPDALCGTPLAGGVLPGMRSGVKAAPGLIPPTPLLRKGAFWGLRRRPDSTIIPGLPGAPRLSLTPPSPAGRGLCWRCGSGRIKGRPSGGGRRLIVFRQRQDEAAHVGVGRFYIYL